MKSKEQKRLEASERQAHRDSLTPLQQIDRLRSRVGPNGAKKEWIRLLDTSQQRSR